MDKETKSHLKNKARRVKEAKHARHYYWQTSCSAWKVLSMTARCLEMELKMLYTGTNNGDLFLSVREAHRRLNVSPNTAAKAFKELQDKGFIKPKYKGSFSQKTRHATSWILTEYAYNGQLPTKDFMRWQPEKKSRSQNLTPTVPKTNTDVQKVIPTPPIAVSEINTKTGQNAITTVADINTQVVYQTGGKYNA